MFYIEDCAALQCYGPFTIEARAHVYAKELCIGAYRVLRPDQIKPRWLLESACAVPTNYR